MLRTRHGVRMICQDRPGDTSPTTTQLTCMANVSPRGEEEPWKLHQPCGLPFPRTRKWRELLHCILKCNTWSLKRCNRGLAWNSKPISILEVTRGSNIGVGVNHTTLFETALVLLIRPRFAFYSMQLSSMLGHSRWNMVM